MIHSNLAHLAISVPDLRQEAYLELKQHKNKEKRKLINAYEEILLSDIGSGVTNPAAIKAYQDANLKSKRQQMGNRWKPMLADIRKQKSWQTSAQVMNDLHDGDF